LKRRRGGNNDGGNNNINLQDRFNKKYFKIRSKGKLKEIIPDDDKIAGSSKLRDPLHPYFVNEDEIPLKVKSPVLTSPSLDDLNSKVTGA
jgi:hypothetical protein